LPLVLKHGMKKIISYLIRFVPRPVLQRLSPIGLKIVGLFYRGNNVECPIIGKSYRKFLPYGRLHPRDNALCPDSLSLERHRLLWLYLKNETDFFTSRKKFLHVAPEQCFLKPFRQAKNLEYTTADIVSPLADVRLDLHDIPYQANEFDVLMANHVLEHVKDDKKCMSEILRVLKPGGWGIMQVPIDYSSQQTLEDPSITDPAERERLYWQRDHVRLYGRDYSEKLRVAGFEVKEILYAKELGAEATKRYALPGEEIIYFCVKPS
jgi:Methyltransferase domain